MIRGILLRFFYLRFRFFETTSIQKLVKLIGFVESFESTPENLLEVGIIKPVEEANQEDIMQDKTLNST